MTKPEKLLVKRLANQLKLHHPDIPFRFDQIDQVGRANGKENKEIHGKWSRGYPDLIIFGKKRPLLLELKATKTVHNTEHTRIQAAYHKRLRELKYKVSFCCGYSECLSKIKGYLSKV